MYPLLELLVEKQIIAPDSDVLDIKKCFICCLHIVRHLSRH